MSWDQYRVVAAETPNASGLKITAPWVQGVDGAVRRVIDVRQSEPVTSAPIDRDEYEQAIRSGGLLKLPDRTAHRYQVTAVLGSVLARGLGTVSALAGVDWTSTAGWLYAYADVSSLTVWRSRAVRALFDWSARALLGYLRRGSPDRDAIEWTVQLAIPLTKERSEERLNAYLLLGLLSTLHDLGGLASLEDVVADEFGWNSAKFRRAIEIHLDDLLESPPGAGTISTADRPLPEIFGDSFRKSNEPVAIAETTFAGAL